MIPKQGGYSLVEVVVAITILSIGSAVLWYSLRSSARLEKANRLHHEANSMARSELEFLRGVPRQDLRDTSYRLQGPGGEELLVVREVYDSADIVSQPELTLDESLSPRELQQPREVRVRVFLAEQEEKSSFGLEALPEWDVEGGAWDAEGRRTLSSLVLKLPEYRWR
jgi:prepilin-type N-terminal cleavage/methylation domain-containing protein